MPTKEKIKWWQNVRRYRGKNGRFISERNVAGYVDQTARNFSEEVRNRTQKLVDDFDEPKFRDWVSKTRKEIKALHNAATIIALGGKKASIRYASQNAEVWRDAQQAIGEQLAFFDRFTLGIVTGSVSINQAMVNRASLYALAAYQTYQNAVRLREVAAAGYDEEMRVTQSGNPCNTCKAQAALGWQKVGTLRRLGDSECISRCRCYFKYRKTPKEK